MERRCPKAPTLVGVRLLAGQLLQCARPIFHVIGAHNDTIFEFVNVDCHDVKAAALSIDTKERRDRCPCGAAAHDERVAVLVHVLNGPIQVRHQLGKAAHLTEESLAGFLVARIVAQADPTIRCRGFECCNVLCRAGLLSRS